MADVFLSYAHADRQKAHELAASLTGYGWTVFWDRAIRSGPRFRDVITLELESAKCVVVLWSRASVQSDWVIDEAEEARTRGRLVPAVIETVKPPHGFRGLQTANLVNWTSGNADAEFDLLVSGIDAHAPRATPSETGRSDVPPGSHIDTTRDNLTLTTQEEAESVSRRRDAPTRITRDAVSTRSVQTPELSISTVRSDASTDPAPSEKPDDQPPPSSAGPDTVEESGGRRLDYSVRPPRDNVPARSVERASEVTVRAAPTEPGVTRPTQPPDSIDTTNVDAGTPATTRSRQRVLVLAIAALLSAGVISVAIFQNSAVPEDLGFDPSAVVMMEVTLPASKYRTGAEVTKGFEALLDRVRAFPGVVQAGAVDVAPTEAIGKNSSIAIAPAAAPVRARINRVMGNYFAVLEMLPTAGRAFSQNEPETSPVAVISRSISTDWTVLGRSASIIIEGGNAAAPTPVTIIGVMGDVRSRETGGSAREPHIYIPAAQDPARRMTVLARMTNANGSAALERGTSALQQAITKFDDQLPTPRVDDMEAVVAASMSQPRFGAPVVTLLGVVATALVLVGAYALWLCFGRHVRVV